MLLSQRRLVLYLNDGAPSPDPPWGSGSRAALCREYAERDRNIVVAEYEDRSCAPPEMRAGWQCVAEAIQAGIADSVLTWSTCMISRDPHLVSAFCQDVLAPRVAVLAEVWNPPAPTRPDPVDTGGRL